MEQLFSISSEAEFEKLLAAAVERQPQTGCEETGARESQKPANLETSRKDTPKETQHEDEH
jgi:hypothetical protein